MGINNARMTFDKETLKPTYQMIIGEAGESCAFYIADRLGMPNEMLKTAVGAAYGKAAVENYHFQSEKNIVQRQGIHKITKVKKTSPKTELSTKYCLGDSVMIFPVKKIVMAANHYIRQITISRLYSRLWRTES